VQDPVTGEEAQEVVFGKDRKTTTEDDVALISFFETTLLLLDLGS
jgi:hypothetical protein